MNTLWRSCDYRRNEACMDGRRSCLGASGCGYHLVGLHMEALKGVMKMNLLIENYDDECGLDYYYIQNNEVKEFGDEIFKKLNKISLTPLLLNSFFENYEGEKEEKRKKAISEIVDCLKSVGYTIKKIFIMNDGTLGNSYMVENK